MDPRDVSEWDQDRKFIVDEIPSMTKDLVDAWVKLGFSREESLEFARVWLRSTFNPGFYDD